MAAHRILGGRKISLPTSLQDTNQQQKQQQQLQQHHSFIETKRSIKHQYNKLVRERDELRDQVIKLANYNYAREPEFVRDRMKLRETIDEVGHLKRHVERRIGLLLDKVLDKLEKEEGKLNENASSKFEESEKFAKSYLNGELVASKHDDFIEEYTKLRKEAHKASILAERLTQEKGNLAKDFVTKVTTTSKDVNNNNNPTDINNNNSSPVPTPRRKKVCFNK